MDGGKKMSERRKYIYTDSTNFKILSSNQMKNVFPTWESLYIQIEDYRKWLENAEINRDKVIKEQYNLMYENVYAILGSRGSGKTSAIFTLKEKIAERNKEDIILPIVMPEVIPEGTETLGWILASLENIVNEWSKKEKENNDSGIFSYCHGDPMQLANIYEEVKELCYSRQVSNGGKTISDDLLRNERRNQSGYEFSIKLTMFWEKLVETIKKSANMEKNKEPLIYLIFDDVDLNPERALEICSMIVKYLSHPNLIIILTADEELLYNVIFDSMLRKMKGVLKYGDYEKVDTSVWEYQNFDQVLNWNMKVSYTEKIRETASLYMSKVLPISRRYPLRVYEECDQKRFFLLDQENSNESNINNELEETLESFLNRNINEFIEIVGEKCGENYEKESNFLYCNGQFLQTYLMLFGNTARQITEAAFVFKKFMMRLREFVKNSEGIFNRQDKILLLREWVEKFISDIMETRGVYWGDTFKVNTIAHNLIVPKDKKNSIYIDYEYLYSLSESMINIDFFNKTPHERRNIVNYCVSLFILAFFTENVLKLMNPILKEMNIMEHQSIHGHGYFVSMLDNMLNPQEGVSSLVKREKKPGDLSNFLNTYGKLIENYSEFIMFHRFKKADVRLYCYMINNNEKIKINFKESYLNNPKWFRTIIPMVWFIYRGVFAIDTEFYNNYVRIFERAPVYGKEHLSFLNRIEMTLIDIISGKDVKPASINAMDEASLLNRLDEIHDVLLEKYNNLKKCTVMDYSEVKQNLNKLINVTYMNYEVSEIAKKIMNNMNTNIQKTNKIQKASKTPKAPKTPQKNNLVIVEKQNMDELFEISNKTIANMYERQKEEGSKIVSAIEQILLCVSFRDLDNDEVKKIENEYIDGIKKIAYSRIREEERLFDKSKAAFNKMFNKIKEERNTSNELKVAIEEAAETYVKFIIQ